MKTKRLERANIAAAQFVASGGDLNSDEAIPLGLELLHAFNDLSAEFGHPILKKIEQK